MIYKAEEDITKQKSSKKKAIVRSLVIIFSAAFLFSGYMLFRTLAEYKEGRDEYDSLLDFSVSTQSAGKDVSVLDETETDFLAPDYDSLSNINGDYIGWLQVLGTSINYPMIFPPDNDSYLRKTFRGTYGYAGSIFLDHRTGSDYDADHIIIYGHRMNDGTMFSDVRKFLDANFYEEHKTFRIYTKHEILTYEIFAARQVLVTDSCFTFSFSNTEEYSAWLASMSAAGNYTTSLTPDAHMPTITLSTCVYNKEESRNIIQAQLVERQPIISG